MARVWYCTREEVKAATDSAETARNNSKVDRAIGSSADSIEGATHRRFYPETDTRDFPWPDYSYSPPWVLELEQHELAELVTLRSAGAVIASTDYFLEPQADGPPYDRIELDLSSSAGFGGGSTAQRSIQLTGVFAGAPIDEVSAGPLSGALTDSATTLTLDTAGAVGVGSLLRVDAERMIVTARSMVTTGQTVQTPLTASMSNDGVIVTSGAAYAVGEIIMLDTERMLIVEIAGNTLAVKRAWDGSTLATHTGSTIYAPRSFTVEREAVGTDVSTHDDDAAVYVWQPPSLIHQWAIAESVTELQQQSAGYARTVGSGESERMVWAGSALKDIRERAMVAHGRKVRNRAV